jgi:hypothetical protein
MTEPPVVYVVCQAEYENNGPVAVFTAAELAGQHAAALPDSPFSKYDVIPLPLVSHIPQRADLHLHAGRVCGAHGEIEDEQTWTVAQWDYGIPAQPVVSIDDRRPEMPRVHVAAASPEAAEAAFRDAVNGMRATG